MLDSDFKTSNAYFEESKCLFKVCFPTPYHIYARHTLRQKIPTTYKKKFYFFFTKKDSKEMNYTQPCYYHVTYLCTRV